MVVRKGGDGLSRGADRSFGGSFAFAGTLQMADELLHIGSGRALERRREATV